MSKRAIIADDHEIVRTAMRSILSEIGDIEVVAEADNGIETIALVKAHSPDLLLLDAAMPLARGVEVFADARRWSPETRVAVVTGFTSVAMLSDWLAAGVDGLFLKSCPPEEMRRGFEAILAGSQYVSEAVERKIAEAQHGPDLTAREREVLALIASGEQNARIAERLLQAQQNAAILTTFNEVNMQPVMDLRTRYKAQFEKEHGARLGFMSFFVKASVEALKRFPAVNGTIDGSDVIYHGYYDIGIAVSSPRGLVVPILRDVDQMSFADIEKAIADFGARAKDGSLSMDDLTGGTFSITNGGIFGSLLSTPILNPPQSGILGMHKIMDRAMVENGQIVARPMMYLALSYDHRIVDGREAVSFLVTIKECLEDPARLLLQV